MTEIKKAIKFAENEITRLEFAPILNECEMTESWREQINVWKVAKFALEKQIPKKPLILGRQYVGVARAGICKNCSMTENSSANYCRYCGQALDWGNRE